MTEAQRQGQDAIVTELLARLDDDAEVEPECDDEHADGDVGNV